MSRTHPSRPALLTFFRREILCWLAKAAKLKVRSSNSSYLVCVAITDAIILPALLPAMTLGKQSAWINACTTPMWYIPMMAPPLSRSAVLPTACLTSPKNYNFLLCEISAFWMYYRPLASSSWYCSINLLDLLYACLNKNEQLVFPIFLLECDRIIPISRSASSSSLASIIIFTSYCIY